MLKSEPRLYNDGNDKFAWLKDHFNPDTYPRHVRSEPMELNALVYAIRDDDKTVGCFISIPTDLPTPDAERFAKAVLKAAERLREGGGTEIIEGMHMGTCEVVTC